MDNGAGVPANTYDASIPFDQDNDGNVDTTITGRVTFSSPLGAAPQTGQVATFTFAAPLVDIDGDASGTLRVEWMDEGIRVSGDVSAEDRTTGRTIDISVDEASPLWIKDATGEPDSQASVCNYAVQGRMSLNVSSLIGTLSSVWNFSFDSNLIQILDLIFAAPESEPRELPDQSTDLDDCGITIDSWIGSWTLNWNCVPLETGTSVHTFVKISETQMRVTTPDGAISYTATLDPNNPRIMRGTFREDEGDGNVYEETFVYTMAPDGNSWSQDNEYEYISGDALGLGGVCFGTATKN